MKQEMLKENLALMEKLKELPVLHSFGTKDMNKLLTFSNVKKYFAGETIIEEGSYDNWIYFLVDGHVRIVKNGEEIDTLRRTGDIFGEMCVIDGSPRSASIEAIDDVTCLATDVSFMDSLYSEDKVAFCAVFYQMIAEVLACRLRETSTELVKIKEELQRLKK
ncbi:MAG: DNA-binding transcriptional activator YeiL [Smithella sp. PtaU1.Bin162]|jgi:CRP/FNR family cyclic AMP-dependent transcriptional regulator|nr:MAG: DNA-binding transcriptional activator YeiL [Smithella sp. PtaU1.Bin162]